MPKERNAGEVHKPEKTINITFGFAESLIKFVIVDQSRIMA